MSADVSDITDQIDDLTADSAEEKDSSEVLADRLRLLLPGNTYWKVSSVIPPMLEKIAESIGAEIAGLDDLPKLYKAVWSTPERVWMVSFHRCVCDDHAEPVWNVEICQIGDDTKVAQHGMTANEFITLLHAVKAIRN
jgi:hypothetical protein